MVNLNTKMVDTYKKSMQVFRSMVEGYCDEYKKIGNEILERKVDVEANIGDMKVYINIDLINEVEPLPIFFEGRAIIPIMEVDFDKEVIVVNTKVYGFDTYAKHIARIKKETMHDTEMAMELTRNEMNGFLSFIFVNRQNRLRDELRELQGYKTKLSKVPDYTDFDKLLLKYVERIQNELYHKFGYKFEIIREDLKWI